MIFFNNLSFFNILIKSIKLLFLHFIIFINLITIEKLFRTLWVFFIKFFFIPFFYQTLIRHYPAWIYMTKFYSICPIFIHEKCQFMAQIFTDKITKFHYTYFRPNTVNQNKVAVLKKNKTINMNHRHNILYYSSKSVHKII